MLGAAGLRPLSSATGLVAWLLGGLPLLLLGWLTPVLMPVVCGPLAAAPGTFSVSSGDVQLGSLC